MGMIKKIFGIEERAENQITHEIESEFLSALLGGYGISKQVALGIPAIAGSVNLISGLVAGINFKLYKKDNKGKLEEVSDNRVQLLNKSTNDLLNGYEMKRAFVRDYILMGNGYIYKEMRGNRVIGLHYVDEINVGIEKNSDPIFKRAKFIVNGNSYLPSNFITIARNSTDGVRGNGILKESNLTINVINNMLKLLNSNTSSGGVKRGFLQSEKVIDERAMDKLKEDFAKILNNKKNGVIVLNKGLSYVPATESSTDMQLKDLYDGISGDVGEVLGVPDNIRNGCASEDEYRNWFKNCINPIAIEISAALDESLLLENEKGDYFWKADTSELENGDLKSRFEAYEIALKNNIMQLDEVREEFGYAPMGFNFVTLGLDKVLYDPVKKIVYTPNTNMIQQMSDIDRKMNDSGESGSEEDEGKMND